MEIYSTNNLIQVVKTAGAPGTFLMKRYFPTTPRDIFKTKEVFIERRDDGNKAAPFVVPYSGSELMVREAYTGEKLTPAFINPARDMTIDTLIKKGIGETMYDDVSPEEREQNYLADDIAYLTDAVTRTKEWMAGQIITQGYVDCKIGNNPASTKHVRLQYFDTEFDNLMTFSTSWSAGASKYEQISDMANDIDGQYGALDLILGADCVVPFMRDEEIQRMLDVKNANFGILNPGETLPEGVGFLGQMNFGGKQLNIYTYNEKVTVNGTEVNYFDPACIAVIPRNNFGSCKHGSISQMEEDDREMHTYTGEMVPRRVTNVERSERKLEMASAPLPHPFAWDSWRVCKPL